MFCINPPFRWDFAALSVSTEGVWFELEFVVRDEYLVENVISIDQIWFCYLQAYLVGKWRAEGYPQKPLGLVLAPAT
jgi:hypothetical protein